MVDCHELRMKIASALGRAPAGGLQFRLAAMAKDPDGQEITERSGAIRKLTDDEASRIEIDKVLDPDVFLQWMQWRHESRAKLLGS